MTIMLDPNDPPERQVEKLNKIVQALILRVEQCTDRGNAPYALFQTAIRLENEVRARTAAVEKALEDLGDAHSELSEALTESRNSRQILLDALAAMSEGFALFHEDRMVICNERFRALLPDISKNVVPGITFEDYAGAVSRSKFLVLDDGQSAKDWEESRLRQHGRLHASFVISLESDRWIQVSDRRMSQGSAAILHTDITRMVREQRLEQGRILNRQARQARATIDQMNQGVCTFDARNTLATSNSKFRELLLLPFDLGSEGASLQEILGFLDRNEILKSTFPKQKLTRWMKDSRTSGSMHLELRRADGPIIDASFTKMRHGGFVGTFTDVTSERSATEALARSKSTLKQRVAARTSALTEANNQLLKKNHEQEKVELELREAKEAAEAANLSKTRFLAAASHDLLQPLNAAKLFISNLRASDLTKEQCKVAASLDRSFNSVESILETLLDISRLDAAGAEFTVSRFPINAILDPLREEFGQIASAKGIGLRMLPSDIWVESDQTYLLRIVQNLLSNAIKYTRTGRVLVGCRRRPDTVRIDVLDTGPGIDQADFDRIFEEFQRLDAGGSDQGMGLGLSFVQRACWQLGHDLKLRSTPGSGSIFSVTVERSRGRDMHAPNSRPVFEPATGADLDVLAAIVENDADVMAAMVGTLERWGISVIPAGSTSDLMSQISDVGIPPDIIIADYHLDGDDTGLRAIRELRRSTGQIVPGILATADRSKNLLRKAASENVEILTKPVEPHLLRELIIRQLDDPPAPTGRLSAHWPRPGENHRTAGGPPD